MPPKSPDSSPADARTRKPITRRRHKSAAGQLSLFPDHSIPADQDWIADSRIGNATEGEANPAKPRQ